MYFLFDLSLLFVVSAENHKQQQNMWLYSSQATGAVTVISNIFVLRQFCVFLVSDLLKAQSSTCDSGSSVVAGAVVVQTLYFCRYNSAYFFFFKFVFVSLKPSSTYGFASSLTAAGAVTVSNHLKGGSGYAL